jgi:hypothetical protein
MSWARRLKRVFAIDIERCRRCGGRVEVIASIEEPAFIKRILAHLERRDEEQRPRSAFAARAPPQRSPRNQCAAPDITPIERTIRTHYPLSGLSAALSALSALNSGTTVSKVVRRAAEKSFNIFGGPHGKTARYAQQVRNLLEAGGGSFV